MLGQKAGVLYILLIFMLVITKSTLLRTIILISSVVGIISAPVWMPIVVGFIPFWEKVYTNHGVWGVIFSLRNEMVESIWSEINQNFNFFDLFFGSEIRFKRRTEMMPLDLLIYFGTTGLFLVSSFLYKTISHWAWSIPIIVACFAGGVYEAPLCMIFYFIVIKQS